MVMASTRRMLRRQLVLMPSADSRGMPACRCGSSRSISQMNSPPGQKPDGRRHPGRAAGFLGHLDRRGEQRPVARGDHDAGGEAEHPVQHTPPDLLEEEHQPGPQRRQEPGEQRPEQGLRDRVKMLEPVDSHQAGPSRQRLRPAAAAGGSAPVGLGQSRMIPSRARTQAHSHSTGHGAARPAQAVSSAIRLAGAAVPIHGAVVEVPEPLGAYRQRGLATPVVEQEQAEGQFLEVHLVADQLEPGVFQKLKAGRPALSAQGAALEHIAHMQHLKGLSIGPTHGVQAQRSGPRSPRAPGTPDDIDQIPAACKGDGSGVDLREGAS